MDKRAVEIITELRGIVVQQQEQGDFVLDRLAELENLLNDGATEPTVTQYSQNDPCWAHLVYSGRYTFERAGCYVVAVAMVASLAGYDWTPPEVAGAMRDAGCFVGGELLHPERIPDALPGLVWPFGAYYNRPGKVMSDDKLDLIRLFIDKYGAMILKLDYHPGGPFQTHFVLAVSHTPDDFEIVDPIDGQRVSMFGRYGMDGWAIGNVVIGYRAVRVEGD